MTVGDADVVIAYKTWQTLLVVYDEHRYEAWVVANDVALV